MFYTLIALNITMLVILAWLVFTCKTIVRDLGSLKEKNSKDLYSSIFPNTEGPFKVPYKKKPIVNSDQKIARMEREQNPGGKQWSKQ